MCKELNEKELNSVVGGTDDITERRSVKAMVYGVSIEDFKPYKRTASGERIKVGGCAVTEDLLELFPYGTRVIVSGYPDILTVNDKIPGAKKLQIMMENKVKVQTYKQREKTIATA